MARKKMDFTIPEELIEKLEIYSKKHMVPKSRLVSKLLDDFFSKKINAGKTKS